MIHILVPQILDSSYVGDMRKFIALTGPWTQVQVSLVEGGMSRPLLRGGVSRGTFLVDDEVWTDVEIERFVSSRLLVDHPLELSTDEVNRIRRNTYGIPQEAQPE